MGILALTRFFKKNKIPLALVKASDTPKYSVDPDKAPETTWSGSKYGGRKSETEGIVAIVEMIKEDLQKEKEKGAMQESLDSSIALNLAKEKELNDVEGQTQDTKDFKSAKNADLAAEEKLAQSIEGDCSWVKTHFQSRRDKRKVEMDGLVEAKSYLSGVEK